jgi:predicted permease
MDYANFMGGMISSEFPYLVLIGCGYLLGRLNLILKEGTIALSKLAIEIFLPVYFFIQVARSTSVEQITGNALIIISNLLVIFLGAFIGYLYTIITKMDIRYRYTWIVIICFTDIRRIHYLVTNTFCYHLNQKSPSEKSFCDDLIANNYSHLFFQQVIMWYIGFNMIRRDRICNNKVINAKKAVDNKDESKTLIKLDVITEKETTELIENKNRLITILTEIEKEEKLNTNNYKQLSSTYEKLNQKPNIPLWKEVLYVLTRPPLIAIFMGFAVGFITIIKNGIFDKKSVIYVYIVN